MARRCHSLPEAEAIISEFGDRSADDLSSLFHQGEVPKFEEIRGDTLGGFLADNAAAPAWRREAGNLAFSKKLTKWKGKRFITPFGEGLTGRGANVFGSRIFSQRLGFKTSIKSSIDDGRPCLRVLYDPFPAPLWGTLDEVRQISEGVLLGKAFYKLPWERRYGFLTYFMLCSLVSPEETVTVGEARPWPIPRVTREPVTQPL